MQPARNAGASLLIAMNSGTFHGMIAATTPTGSRRTRLRPNMPLRSSSHGKDSASCCCTARTAVAGVICIMLTVPPGAPISLEMTPHTSSARAARSSVNLASTAARSAGVERGHGPESKAARAAVTAASTSASTASGTEPTSSRVAGERTSIVAEPAGATHWPPMKSLS